MNFGYLLVVSEHTEIDYLKMAYALALSIKNTQHPEYANVALVIDNVDLLTKLKYVEIFDQIIQWNEQTGWDGRSWMDQLTPWDYTVCLDVDMLFLKDYSHVIKHLIENNFDIFLPSTAFTYKGQEITNDFYRKTFTLNSIPNLYSFFTFFKKESTLTNDFFNLGRYIITHPTEFSNTFLTNHKPKIIGTDEAFSLSAKILDITDKITFQTNSIEIVHLKPMIQNLIQQPNNIFDLVNFYFDDNANVKIGPYQQLTILHYVDKSIIVDEYVEILERILCKHQIT